MGALGEGVVGCGEGIVADGGSSGFAGGGVAGVVGRAPVALTAEAPPDVFITLS